MNWFSNTNIDFVKLRKKAYIFSGVLILIGLISILFIRQGLNYGIDFDGGIKMQIKFDERIDLNEQNRIRKELNVSLKRVQTKEGSEIIIEKKIPGFSEELAKRLIEARAKQGTFETLKQAADVIELDSRQIQDFERIFTTEKPEPTDLSKLKESDQPTTLVADTEEDPEIADYMKINLNTANQREIENGIAQLMTQSIVDKFESQLKEIFAGKNTFEIRETTLIGPKVGKELRKTAMVIIIFALLGLLIYISLRFELKYAIGAVLALVHDVLITVGVFSVLGKEFTIPIIAAILTIIGYSLNDTIVIFDRIRETIKTSRRKSTYDEIINESINKTLTRTFLTSLTTFLVVLAIFIWGGEALHDFSFALMIGIITGTYSSVFVASPLLVEWAKLFPHAKK